MCKIDTDMEQAVWHPMSLVSPIELILRYFMTSVCTYNATSLLCPPPNVNACVVFMYL